MLAHPISFENGFAFLRKQNGKVGIWGGFCGFNGTKRAKRTTKRTKNGQKNEQTTKRNRLRLLIYS